MHGTYCFLMDDIELVEDEEKLFKEINSSFDSLYGEHRCDENNWYTVYGAITQSGRVLGKDEFREQKIKELPDAKKRFQKTLEFATGCVAIELELFDVCPISIGPKDDDATARINKMSHDELVAAIYEWVPKELAKAYLNFERPKEPGSFDRDGYKRSKRARGFEMFNDSYLKPFSPFGNPYEYRCFDIRQAGSCSSEFGENDIIVLVDIHT